MLKYIFFPTTRILWRNLSIALSEQGVACPVLWVGHRSHDQFARQRFPQCQVFSFNDINKGIANFPVFDHPEKGNATKMVSEPWFPAFKDQVIRMFDRKDYFGGFRSVDRDAIFYQLLFQLYAMIENEKPNFLLMAESPHSAATLVIYRICEYLEIPIIFYMSNLVFPGLVLKNGIDKAPIKLSCRVDQNNFKEASRAEVDRMIANLIDSQAKPKQPKYMLNQYRKERKRRLGRLPKAIREVLRSLIAPMLPNSMRARTYSAFHGFSAFGNNPGAFSEALKYITEVRAQHALLKAYSEKSVSEENFPSKYVFFPLHYEPERTSNPDGGEWNNQYHAIARLRRLLPDDVTILIKEHPSQLGSVLQGFRGRSRFFYGAISAIGGIAFASTDISSWNIQRKALFTCTITGTAALEAAIMGMPALLMGHPWFRDCPGITNIGESTTVDEILDNTASIEDVRSYLYRLINEYAIFGVVNPGNEKHFSKWFEDGASGEEELAGITEVTIMEIQTLVKSKNE